MCFLCENAYFCSEQTFFKFSEAFLKNIWKLLYKKSPLLTLLRSGPIRLRLPHFWKAPLTLKNGAEPSGNRLYCLWPKKGYSSTLRLIIGLRIEALVFGNWYSTIASRYLYKVLQVCKTGQGAVVLSEASDHIFKGSAPILHPRPMSRPPTTLAISVSALNVLLEHDFVKLCSRSSKCPRMLILMYI